MKFLCTKENLSQALSIVGGVAGKNLNLPILSNVLIRADEQKVEIVATNLEFAATATVRAKIDSPGSFTVPARTLSEFVNLLPNENITVLLEGSELVVSCGKTKTKIKGSPAEEFPIVPTVDAGTGFVVAAQDLKTALEQVLPSVAHSEIRPELSGVFFGFNSSSSGMLTLAATDSYRLAEKKMSLQQGGEEQKIIVPGRAAKEITRALASAGSEEKNARLLVGENQLALFYDGVQIVSRLVDGAYPDYTQIIPKEFATSATVSSGKLNQEIKAAGIFTTSGVNAVELKFLPEAGHIEVSSTSQQTGEHRSEVPAEITGKEGVILLNHRYVLDGLSAAGSESVTIKSTGGESPCAILPNNNGDFLYIIMPIRQ